MQSTKILGVRIDLVDEKSALAQIEEWTKQKSPKVIVTPNIEFIIEAQQNDRFRNLLNQSDMAISDSSRLGWVEAVVNDKNPLTRFLKWLVFPFSGKLIALNFPILTGADLMDAICQEAAQKNWKIGLIGGAAMIAEKTAKALQKKYSKLEIVFAQSGGLVNLQDAKTSLKIPACDILFVAFGHVKQETWIDANKSTVSAKVFMGVGGAFDYISGNVPRAPKIWQNLGLEWLFRLITQPWRIKRQIKIVIFVFQLLFR